MWVCTLHPEHNLIWQPQTFVALEITRSPQSQGQWQPLQWLHGTHHVNWNSMWAGGWEQAAVLRNRTLLPTLVGGDEDHSLNPWEVTVLLNYMQEYKNFYINGIVLFILDFSGERVASTVSFSHFSAPISICFSDPCITTSPQLHSPATLPFVLRTWFNSLCSLLHCVLSSVRPFL